LSSFYCPLIGCIEQCRPRAGSPFVAEGSAIIAHNLQAAHDMGGCCGFTAADCGFIGSGAPLIVEIPAEAVLAEIEVSTAMVAVAPSTLLV